MIDKSNPSFHRLPLTVHCLYSYPSSLDYHQLLNLNTNATRKKEEMVRSLVKTTFLGHLIMLSVCLASMQIRFILFSSPGPTMQQMDDEASASILLPSVVVEEEAEQEPPRIPHRLIFSYKYNMLEKKTPPHIYENVMNTIRHYREAWNEPDAPVWFLDDTDCRIAIKSTKPELLPHFDSEALGSLRGDICRVAALYLRGGYYFDIDMQVVEPVLLDNNVTFVTAYDESKTCFFQSLIFSEPGNAIVLKSMDNIHTYYNNSKRGRDVKLGPTTLIEAYESMPPAERGKIRLFDEIHLDNEGLVYPQIPRQDGVGCCCNFAVHDSLKQKVYFYSRVVGAGEFCKFKNIRHTAAGGSRGYKAIPK